MVRPGTAMVEHPRHQQAKTLRQIEDQLLSPQVDNGLQSILAKAEIPRTAETSSLRNQQARQGAIVSTWSFHLRRTRGSSHFAVSLVGGQTFVYRSISQRRTDTSPIKGARYSSERPSANNPIRGARAVSNRVT